MRADAIRETTIPKPQTEPMPAPFVGNLSVDDNIAEGVRVAIWSAIGERAHAIVASVAEGIVTLTGQYRSAAEQAAVHRAVSGVPGVHKLVDAGDVGIAAEHSAVVTVQEKTPLVQVTRFCGLDEASMSAAIRQAVDVLDAFMVAQGAALPQTLIIRYRNPIEGAMTLEIGVPTAIAPASIPRGEIGMSALPAGPRTRQPVAGGVPGLVAGVADLTARGAEAIWQEFGAETFRPWRRHPDSELIAILPPVPLRPRPDRRG